MICEYCSDKIEDGERYAHIDLLDANVHEECIRDVVLDNIDKLVNFTYHTRGMEE